MGIRGRILIFIIASLVVLSGAVTYLTTRLVADAYHQLENDVMERTWLGMQAALKSTSDTLDRLTSDWAFWDDTYQFIRGEHPDYVDVNLKDEDVANINLQLLLYIDAVGELKYGTIYDPEGERISPSSNVVSLIMQEVSAAAEMKQPGDSTGGFIVLDDRVFLFRAHPILPSSRSGEPAGILIFGMDMQPGIVSYVSDIAQHEARLFIGNPQDIRANGPSPGSVSAGGLIQHDGDVVHIYAGLLDSRGGIVGYIRTEVPRSIHIQLGKTQKLITTSVVVTVLVLGIGMLLLMERNTLRPLSRIIDSVIALQHSPPSARLTPTGRGELRQLARAVNQLLASVEQNQKLRQDAVRHLLSEKENLAVTLASIGDGVITTDAHRSVLLMNPAAQALTGWTQEQAAGKSLELVLPLLDEQTSKPVPNLTVAAGRENQPVSRNHHVMLATGDNRVCPITDNCAPIRDSEGQLTGYVVVFRDMTKIRQADRQQAITDKLNAIGTLAGGIAHDFNNLLTSISHSISLARNPATSSHRTGEYLLSAEQSILRARSLTKKLLTFAPGGDPVREPTDLHDLLRSTSDLVCGQGPHHVHLDFDDGLLCGDVDPGQMEQVFYNVIQNAVEAMPDGGDVHIRTSNVFSDVENHADELFVRIEIADKGVGIPEALQERIFEPYFTTKKQAGGLGLASARSIVAKHGGVIRVDSRVGEGTTFTILLPATTKVRESDQVPALADFGGDAQGRILFMDDEEMLLNLSKDILCSVGFDVDVAPDGATAVALYRQAMAEGRPFNLVVLDLVVQGGMGGLETLRQMKQIDPAVVAIVSSGYSNDPIMAHYADHGFREVLPKPYSSASLIEAAHRLIDTGTCSAA